MQKSSAFRFVFLMSLVSLFGDMTYEGARSALGPFFAALGASGTVVGVVSGFGELLGFGIRYLSGIAADRSRKYWDIAIVGYTINVLSVPALALARTWPIASIFVLGERAGRGLRKPASNVLVSYAGTQLGQAWVFGFREAMDQTGATIGPLIVAGILALGLSFSNAFAWLALPAILSLIVLLVARRLFPAPSQFERKNSTGNEPVSNRAYWLYTAGAAMLAFGFADFSLIAYNFTKEHTFSTAVIPIVYAAAMLAAAVASPLLGRAYDRFGHGALLVTVVIVALYAPVAFLGGPFLAIVGAVLWGVGMASQDVLFPAIVARIAPSQSRASAFGTFDAIYGIAWFAGSAAMGVLYDHGILFLVIVSLVAQLAFGLPVLLAATLSEGRSAR